MSAEGPILEVKDLQTQFHTRSGTLKAVDGLSFSVGEGETLGIVGESGCGKSMTALSIMRLVPSPPGEIVAGEVIVDGVDLMKLDEDEMEDVRGNRVSMIFQEPLTALNPLFTIGHQLGEVVRRHQHKKRQDVRDDVVQILNKVGLPDVPQQIKSYPHQLSGGMRQRAMIAMALLAHPRVLLADEPTTALDVTIQAQILELIREIRDDLGGASVMITHDLGVVADIADSVIVMYAGRIVESAPVLTLFDRPAHPYTLGLHASIPSMVGKRSRLNAIPGQVPTLRQMGSMKGCRFAARCSFATDECTAEEPPLERIELNHEVRCWHYDQVLESQGTTLTN